MEVFCCPLGGVSLSLVHSVSFTHSGESVKIPIIRLAFSPSMLDAVIKRGAKFELVSKSDGPQPTNRPPFPSLALSLSLFVRVCVYMSVNHVYVCAHMCACALYHCFMVGVEKKANSSMFFSRMWSRPKPETTTLSSQTATGLRDIKSTVFCCFFFLKKQRQKRREGGGEKL